MVKKSSIRIVSRNKNTPVISIKREIVGVTVEKKISILSDSKVIMSEEQVQNKQCLKYNGMIEEADCFRIQHQGFDCGDIVEDCLIAKREFCKRVTI